MKNTNKHKNEIGSNRANFASLDKALLDTVMSRIPLPPENTGLKLKPFFLFILLFLLLFFFPLRLYNTKKESTERTFNRVVDSSVSAGSLWQAIAWSELLVSSGQQQQKGKKKVNDPNNKIRNWLYNHRYKLLRSIISFLLKITVI